MSDTFFYKKIINCKFYLVVFITSLAIILLQPGVVKAGGCTDDLCWDRGNCNLGGVDADCPGGYTYVTCQGADPPYNKGQCCGGCRASSDCGGSAWPSCGGDCPEGSSCVSAQEAPCRCQTPRSCSDVIPQVRDPVATYISPNEVNVKWQMMRDNSYVTRMSLVVDAIYGNYPPVFDEENFDPRVIGEWNVSGLTAGKYYRVAVHYYADGAVGWASLCSTNATVTYLSSCRLLPDPLNLAAAGSTGTLTTELVDDVGRVNYGITSGFLYNVISVDKNTDNTNPYTTSVTGIGNGQTSVTNAIQVWTPAVGAWVSQCTDTAIVNVGALPTATPTPTSDVPICVCGAYNVVTGNTPVTCNWLPTQASGLQVWDTDPDGIVPPATWWFNNWTTPPHTVSNIPTGRIIYARTTYNFTSFSVTTFITCPIPTPTSIPTPTPTPTTAPGAWIKLKNTSFISKNSLTSLIPLVPAAYDADDDGSANFIIGTGGVVGAPSVNVTGTNANAKTSSPNEYKVTGYSPANLMTPSSFLSYIKARKQHKVITSLDQITADGIYIWTSPVDIDSKPIFYDQFNVVLIVQGTININANLTPADPNNKKSLAVVANQINFGNTTTSEEGIFVADSIDSGTAGFGLKIIGNLIAQTSFSNSRTQSNLNKPAIFIVFDQQKYIDLLPYLSTANYDWRQIQ